MKVKLLQICSNKTLVPRRQNTVI